MNVEVVHDVMVAIVLIEDGIRAVAPTRAVRRLVVDDLEAFNLGVASADQKQAVDGTARGVSDAPGVVDDGPRPAVGSSEPQMRRVRADVVIRARRPRRRSRESVIAATCSD